MCRDGGSQRHFVFGGSVSTYVNASRIQPASARSDLDPRRLDEHHCAHWLAGEVHRPDVPLVEGCVGAFLAEAQHQLVADDAAGHVTADEERDTTEHLLLTDIRNVLKEDRHPLCEALIEGHLLRLTGGFPAVTQLKRGAGCT